MVWKIDEVDRQILQILQADASITNEEIGKKVGLSEPAVRRRVKNLVKQGIIRRFTIDISESWSVSALVLVSTSPEANQEKLMKLICLQEWVKSAWEISGEMDIAVMVCAPDLESLNRCIDEIRKISGVVKTQTHIIMKKRK
ncbi:MAG: Lrp/AsnC family transcriptional regulator [Candidatus Anstonellaceae archaeon]